METYGRNRQSIADIERELYKIFEKHPNCHINDAGEPTVPGNGVVDILQSFSDMFDTPLMSEEETDMLQVLIQTTTGLEVTPPLLMQFIAEKTKVSPPRSPMHDEEGRSSDDERDIHRHSRTLSTESSTTYHQGPHSRPPSRGPSTPSVKSPLDSERRQRSTPLNNAPSSWAKRPTPAGRRKSDAGSRSDSESGGPPTVWGRSTSGRARTPSNPTSPTTSSRDLNFSPGSPDYAPRSRPHSRARSQPQNGFNNSFDHGYSSPDDTVKRPMSRYGYNKYNDSFDNDVSTLPMPRTGSDSDDEDFDTGLVLDRASTSSTVSMEIHERLEALQRTNEELSRKRMEAEQTLQNKLAEHELELEETHQRLEELRSELSASNREEKELRAKDSRNLAQIAALEAEVAKVQKALDGAKATYSSLQRQYQEQCSVSEKYRDDLRAREETIRNLKEAVSLHEIETVKWAKEHESYEDRIAQLELELNIALQAHTHLDEQKQENMLLKETIDRMRFDMDDMRAAMTAVASGGSGHSSAANTMSKSLGAELAGKLNWEDPNDQSAQEDYPSPDITVVEEEETEVEDEEEVQTIITKRKRKVPSRAQVVDSRRPQFDELKEYSDTSTQYDPTLFAVNHSMQTEPEPKPLKASFSIQTDEIPQPKPLPPPPPRITVEMEIQTEEAEDEPSRSPSPAHDESMVSSSSTIVPLTPKPQAKQLDHLDEPPAYNQVTEADQEEREWRVAAETLKKWHHGVKIPFEPVAGGISEEAVEEWKALKQELGVECMVIDKIVASSEKTGGSSRSPKDAKPRRGGRFYNIYNTYVYGDKSTSFTSGLAGQAMMFMGASALVILAVTPYMVPQNSIPGGVTYYDRAAWNSFNSMPGAGEGFSPDGTAAVWNFLGRVGGGAARIARGWPT
ncbi:hypothetical protein GALMADRAFT_225716 [Galerina marginata CBS 339.88]|uniref:Uncharacterized protein n=1 Tax=Galerina marginata (strain CBS 339.88) TaxID=685588 RepID=A0A067T109_GALM3|nr:hypothetical protein GALMADRAFT_225716 [Galerina marginata CBS 339.88]